MGKEFKRKGKAYKPEKYHGIQKVPKRPEPSSQFSYGLKYEEYHDILYKINEYAQAEFAGEVGGELKTRVESKLHIHRALNDAMLLEAVGARYNYPNLTQARWDRLQDEAQKRHSVKRDEYYKNVKEFIGQVCRKYVHKDMMMTLQNEPEYNALVNNESSAISFMEWLENVIKRKLRWSIDTQLGSIENLIKGDYNIVKAKSPMSYVTMMKQLIKEYKSLKLKRLVEELEAYENRRMAPEMVIVKEIQVSNEVNRSNFLLINIYREIKENGLTKEIRQMWTNKEREKCLKSNECPFDTIESLLTEAISQFDYMLTENKRPEPEEVHIRINNTVVQEKKGFKKCYRCVEERGENKVNHKWYDCYRYNTKCKNYKGDKKKGVDEKDIAKAIQNNKDPKKLAAAINALIKEEETTSNSSDSNESE